MDTTKNVLLNSPGFWQISQIEHISTELRKLTKRLIEENYNPDLLFSELIKQSMDVALLHTEHPESRLDSAIQTLRAERLTYEPSKTETLH